MIKSVRLENWRTHKDSLFEFSRGTNVLIGVMGSGKTSVMDAICFALFGTFPGVTARNLRLDEVITSKPHEKDFARVRLEFDYRGEDYAVERTVYRKGTNEGKLYRGGKLIAGPKTTEATARLEEILEMNYDLFSRAVYSEQNQLDYFLRLSAAQRKEKFDELLEISKYENVRGNAVALSNRLKKMAEDRKAFLEEQRKRLDERELREAKESLGKKERLAKDALARLETEKKELSRAEKEAAALEKQEKEFRSLRDAAVKARARAGEAERTARELEREAAGVSAEKATHRRKQLEEESKKARETAQALEKKADRAEEERSSLLQQVAANEREAARLRKAAEQLREAKANCPVCRAKLEEHAKHGLLKETEREEAELEKKTKEFREHAGKAAEEKEKLRQEARQAQRALDGLAEEKAEVERALKAAERLEKAKAETRALATQAGHAEKELAKISFDEGALRKAREQTAGARERINSADKKAADVKALAAG